MTAYNLECARKTVQLEQFQGLRMIAGRENDLNAHPPVMPDDRRKERDVRRVVEVDPNRFSWVLQRKVQRLGRSICGKAVLFRSDKPRFRGYAAVSADREMALF